MPLCLAACSGQPLAPEQHTATEAEAAAGRVPLGEFMATVYTYPTGRFEQRWLAAARVQDAAVKAARPAGSHGHLKATSALDPARATPLGPQPLDNSGDLNAGRVNDIVVSPQPLIPGDPNSYRAFVASDGGGVWRSSNCCSAATTWEPVTDDPEFASIAIGDLELDPSNPNTIYAGTGDLRFGTWAFGAVGVLKSIDGGDHWRLLGRDVFVPNYPTPVGAFPQYQAVGKIAVDPNNADRVVVGTKTGLYFSYDAGQNWTGPCLTNEYGPNSSNPHRQDITGLLALNLGGSTRLVAAVDRKNVV